MNIKHRWKTHTSFKKRYSWKKRSGIHGQLDLQVLSYTTYLLTCIVNELKQLKPRKTRGQKYSLFKLIMYAYTVCRMEFLIVEMKVFKISFVRFLSVGEMLMGKPGRVAAST